MATNDKIQKQEPKIIPNKAKSVEGKWYPFQAQYQITEITKLDDERSGSKQYRITISFPDEARTGINPSEFAIQGRPQDKDYGWKCFYYGMTEKEVPEEMRKMAKVIRELRRYNRNLQSRNRKLEAHFTKTIYDEEREREKMEGYNIQECQFCGDRIDTKRDLEGRDYTYVGEDGDLAHLDCAVEAFSYVCSSPECATLWTEDTEGDGTCPECHSELKKISAEEVKKRLVYNALQHYVPEELRGTFKVLYVEPTKSKHHSYHYNGTEQDIAEEKESKR